MIHHHIIIFRNNSIHHHLSAPGPAAALSSRKYSTTPALFLCKTNPISKPFPRVLLFERRDRFFGHWDQEGFPECFLSNAGIILSNILITLAVTSHFRYHQSAYGDATKVFLATLLISVSSIPRQIQSSRKGKPVNRDFHSDTIQVMGVSRQR